MALYFIVAFVAYLLGSIPFGYILMRVFRGEDVRAIGSGNIGATNVARKAPGLGVATLILDAGKGFVAVTAAMEIMRRLHPPAAVLVSSEQWESFRQVARPGAQHFYLIATVAAVFAILGHVFPVWLKFKGGKGVATGVGAFVALAPKAVLIVLLIFVVIVAAFRYISLGSIVAAAAFPIFAWLLYRYQASPAVFAAMVCASALIIAKHHQNIRRLLAGTEHRFELKHR
ncbi:MAG: glycerol-3-phosphate 1-O-acyltransferase PlsY [Acidobacteriia bacterium]|nr:glycerol-3-phosphate 1-O-acyltransferase PlsY [Terriglobia bacterium]